ncbi:hypothetical protein OG896_11265 [Streptomyces sp. NBC_00669]|nr:MULTISPECIES: hypothetical protein [unclassified Streptomyces]
MRVMLSARMDTQVANKAIKNGAMEKLMQSLAEQLKPEAAYFFAREGERCSLFVFDMQDSSQLPGIVEPLFEELGARIEIQPVMNVEELRKGLAAAR